MKILGPVVRAIVILAMVARRDLQCWNLRCDKGVVVSGGAGSRKTNKTRLDPFEKVFALAKKGIQVRCEEV